VDQIGDAVDRTGWECLLSSLRQGSSSGCDPFKLALKFELCCDVLHDPLLPSRRCGLRSHPMKYRTLKGLRSTNPQEQPSSPAPGCETADRSRHEHVVQPFCRRPYRARQSLYSRQAPGAARSRSGQPAAVPRQPGDIVLVENGRRQTFCRPSRKPAFPCRSSSSSGQAASIRQQSWVGEFRGLRPWAWATGQRPLLEPLFDRVIGETRLANQYFNDDIARLYSKAWSAGFLRRS
jgi:hypothetical protein